MALPFVANLVEDNWLVALQSFLLQLPYVPKYLHVDINKLLKSKYCHSIVVHEFLGSIVHFLFKATTIVLGA